MVAERDRIKLVGKGKAFAQDRPTSIGQFNPYLFFVPSVPSPRSGRFGVARSVVKRSELPGRQHHQCTGLQGLNALLRGFCRKHWILRSGVEDDALRL